MTGEQVRQLAQWVDANSTSLSQALRMAAESNQRDAHSLHEQAATAGDLPGYPGSTCAMARFMTESAASWRRMADELDQLVDALPDDIDGA